MHSARPPVASKQSRNMAVAASVGSPKSTNIELPRPHASTPPPNARSRLCCAAAANWRMYYVPEGKAAAERTLSRTSTAPLITDKGFDEGRCVGVP